MRLFYRKKIVIYIPQLVKVIHHKHVDNVVIPAKVRYMKPHLPISDVVSGNTYEPGRGFGSWNHGGSEDIGKLLGGTWKYGGNFGSNGHVGKWNYDYPKGYSLGFSGSKGYNYKSKFIGAGHNTYGSFWKVPVASDEDIGNEVHDLKPNYNNLKTGNMVSWPTSNKNTYLHTKGAGQYEKGVIVRPPSQYKAYLAHGKESYDLGSRFNFPKEQATFSDLHNGAVVPGHDDVVDVTYTVGTPGGGKHLREGDKELIMLFNNNKDQAHTSLGVYGGDSNAFPKRNTVTMFNHFPIVTKIPEYAPNIVGRNTAANSGLLISSGGSGTLGVNHPLQSGHSGNSIANTPTWETAGDADGWHQSSSGVETARGQGSGYQISEPQAERRMEFIWF